MSMSLHIGHSVGKLHTLLLHLGHWYPEIVNFSWLTYIKKLCTIFKGYQVQNDGLVSGKWVGNPINTSSAVACSAETGGGGTCSITRSFKWSSSTATRYVPPVSVHIVRQTWTSAVILIMDVRMVSCLRCLMVVEMSPGSWVVILAINTTISLAPCFGTRLEIETIISLRCYVRVARASSNAFWRDGSPFNMATSRYSSNTFKCWLTWLDKSVIFSPTPSRVTTNESWEIGFWS